MRGDETAESSTSTTSTPYVGDPRYIWSLKRGEAARAARSAKLSLALALVKEGTMEARGADRRYFEALTTVHRALRLLEAVRGSNQSGGGASSGGALRLLPNQAQNRLEAIERDALKILEEAVNSAEPSL